MNYYDSISSGYDELHSEEQLKKLAIVKQNIKPKKNDKLLDVGCGTGISSDWDCIVYAVDPSQGLLRIFKDRIKKEDKQNKNKKNDAGFEKDIKKNQNKIFIKQACAEELPFKDNEFDYILSLTAIQNFDDIKQGLKEMKRVGKKKFALSFLKRSERKEYILELVEHIFVNFNITQIEEDKDIILIIDD